MLLYWKTIARLLVIYQYITSGLFLKSELHISRANFWLAYVPVIPTSALHKRAFTTAHIPLQRYVLCSAAPKVVKTLRHRNQKHTFSLITSPSFIIKESKIALATNGHRQTCTCTTNRILVKRCMYHKYTELISKLYMVDVM